MPPSVSTEFETQTPLLISKEEADNIKVVALTTFPLFSGMMGAPALMSGGSHTKLNPIAFLTESIKDKGRFKIISTNEFRKKLMESHEMFDKSLTQDEINTIAQRVGKLLGADAVMVVEMDRGQRGEGNIVAQSFHTGFTGRATVVQKTKMYMVSTDSKKIIWNQTLKTSVTSGAISSQTDETVKSTISPLIDNLHASFL